MTVRKTIQIGAFIVAGLNAHAFASVPQQDPIAPAKQPTVKQASADLVTAVKADAKKADQIARPVVNAAVKDVEKVIRDDVKPALKKAEQDARPVIKDTGKSLEKAGKEIARKFKF